MTVDNGEGCKERPASQNRESGGAYPKNLSGFPLFMKSIHIFRPRFLKIDAYRNSEIAPAARAGTLWLVNQRGIVFDQIGVGVTGGLFRPAVLTEVLMLGAYLARVLLDGACFRPRV